MSEWVSKRVCWFSPFFYTTFAQLDLSREREQTFLFLPFYMNFFFHSALPTEVSLTFSIFEGEFTLENVLMQVHTFWFSALVLVAFLSPVYLHFTTTGKIRITLSTIFTRKHGLNDSTFFSGRRASDDKLARKHAIYAYYWFFIRN